MSINLPWSLWTVDKNLIPDFITNSLQSACIYVHHDPLAEKTSDMSLLIALSTVTDL
jgi:hypothetical protein